MALLAKKLVISCVLLILTIMKLGEYGLFKNMYETLLGLLFISVSFLSMCLYYFFIVFKYYKEFEKENIVWNGMDKLMIFFIILLILWFIKI